MVPQRLHGDLGYLFSPAGRYDPCADQLLSRYVLLEEQAVGKTDRNILSFLGNKGGGSGEGDNAVLPAGTDPPVRIYLGILDNSTDAVAQMRNESAGTATMSPAEDSCYS